MKGVGDNHFNVIGDDMDIALQRQINHVTNFFFDLISQRQLSCITLCYCTQRVALLRTFLQQDDVWSIS